MTQMNEFLYYPCMRESEREREYTRVARREGIIGFDYLLFCMNAFGKFVCRVAWLYICIRLGLVGVNDVSRTRLSVLLASRYLSDSPPPPSRFSRRERGKERKEKQKKEVFFPVFHFHSQSFLMEEREAENVRLLLTLLHLENDRKNSPYPVKRFIRGLSRAVSAKCFMYWTH